MTPATFKTGPNSGACMLVARPVRKIVFPTAVPDPPSDFNYFIMGISSDGINAIVRTGVRNCSGINNLAARSGGTLGQISHRVYPGCAILPQGMRLKVFSKVYTIL